MVLLMVCEILLDFGTFLTEYDWVCNFSFDNHSMSNARCEVQYSRGILCGRYAAYSARRIADTLTVAFCIRRSVDM